jgi:hypothetical protein
MRRRDHLPPRHRSHSAASTSHRPAANRIGDTVTIWTILGILLIVAIIVVLVRLI